MLSIALVVSLAAGFLGALIVGIVRSMRTPGARAWLVLLSGLLALYGWAGFFAQAAGAAGLYASVPASVEFPVWRPDSLFRNGREQTFVGLGPVGRIQVYDADGRFLRGWFVPARGGSFSIEPAPGGRVLVRIVRGRQKLLYDAEGRVAEAAVASVATGESLVSARPPIDASWTPLWWPLASPLAAWVVGVIGIVGVQGREMLRRLRRLGDRRETR